MPTINVFDRTLKVIAQSCAETFLRLAFPGQHVELLGEEANVTINLPEERVDFVHQVRHEGQEYVLHFEFQLAHRSVMPRRLFIYAGLLTAQKDLPVITLVLYLQPRVSDVPSEYAVSVGGVVTNRFTYQVVRLWEHVDEIRAGGLRELAPLLVTLVENPDEALLAEERELILREEDPRKRGALLATAVTVAARFFDREFLWAFFKEELEQMRNATFIEDWIEEAEERAARKAREEASARALVEGRNEGELRQARANLTRVVVHQFGSIPTRWHERIEALTVGQLETLTDQALDAPDLRAFEKELPPAP